MNWREVLANPHVKGIIAARKERKADSSETSEINIFKLISDYYFRENFHSDVIKEFLDPNGSHKEGDLYLDIFIKMLKVYGLGTIEDYYSDAEVVREKYKIDILIKGLNPDDNGLYHYIIGKPKRGCPLRPSLFDPLCHISCNPLCQNKITP